MIRRAIWFFVFSVMAISCLDQPDCFSLNNNIVGISFRKLSNNTADTVAVIGISSDGTDSIFHEEVLTTGINLPLNLYSESTTFNFEGLERAYDLTLSYSTQVQFVSEDCGSKFVISNLQASSATFDSVRVVSSTPKSRNIPGTNIEVYRCPNTSRIELRFGAPVTITNVQTDYPATIFGSTAPVTTFALPLNIASTKSKATFTLSNGAVKTLTVQYDITPQTLFNACGEQIVISNLSIVAAETDFTAATVVRTSIQDPNQTNIEITL